MSIATQVAAGVTSSRAVIVDDLLWRVRTLRMILSMVTAQPDKLPQVLRTRVHFTRVYRLDPAARHSAPSDPARQADAERLHRKLQRQVPRRVPERSLVHVAATGARRHRQLAHRLQRSPPAQQLWPNPAGAVRHQPPTTTGGKSQQQNRDTDAVTFNPRTSYLSVVRRLGAGQAGNDKSTSIPSPSRLKSSMTLNSR